MSSLLQFNGVGYRYPDAEKAVLERVSLAVSAGEIVRITGRNGAGKSTLMKIICGELIADIGRISKKSSLRSTYLNQFSGDMLAMDLTIAETGRSFAHFCPSSSCEESVFVASLEYFNMGLESKLDSFCGQLSGGQRQAVALAAALGSEAEILCLDEFTSNLDGIAEAAAVRSIEAAVEKRMLSVFYASHGNIGLVPNKTILLGDEG